VSKLVTSSHVTNPPNAQLSKSVSRLVAGALLPQLLCQNVISSHNEGSSQQEGPVSAFGLHSALLLVGIPGLNKGEVTGGYGHIAGFRTGSAVYFLHPTYLPTYLQGGPR
jgi:hypothetical protein